MGDLDVERGPGCGQALRARARSVAVTVAVVWVTSAGCSGSPAPTRATAESPRPAAAEQAPDPDRPEATDPARARPVTESLPEPVEPPALTGDPLAALKPVEGEPPELSALKARLVQGGTSSTGDLKALQKLSHKHPKNAEIPFLLGQLYLSRLWVGDGLKALKRAIELDPTLRHNPFLIRAAINGLGNDRDQAQVRRFVTGEIGLPAAPYLEEVLYGEWRQQVKDRAAGILGEITSESAK